jgi:hypothetical protein
MKQKIPIEIPPYYIDTLRLDFSTEATNSLLVLSNSKAILYILSIVLLVPASLYSDILLGAVI